MNRFALLSIEDEDDNQYDNTLEIEDHTKKDVISPADENQFEVVHKKKRTPSQLPPKSIKNSIKAVPSTRARKGWNTLPKDVLIPIIWDYILRFGPTAYVSSFRRVYSKLARVCYDWHTILTSSSFWAYGCNLRHYGTAEQKLWILKSKEDQSLLWLKMFKMHFLQEEKDRGRAIRLAKLRNQCPCGCDSGNWD